MTTAPIDVTLATEVAETLLKQITESAKDTLACAQLHELAQAYATVMGVARSNERARAYQGRS